MMISGYRLVEQLRRNGNADILRCVEEASQKPVIIKRHAAGTREAAQLKHEYDILQTLARAGVHNVVRARGLLEEHGFVALILDDIGAEAVLVRSRTTVSRREALVVALAVADALVGVHEAGIIHKDIKPDNIVYNRDTQAVQLIDFGIAAHLDRELQAMDSLQRLEGTVAYVSPEQTGRINRMMDYRSDFYSLGVVLYEMMTGIVPFTGDTVSQQIHAILSRVPARPKNVPEPVVDIMFKLLEKDPEKRYQSARGLRHDLALCVEGLQQDGNVAAFRIATQDISERFEIPQHLYGRSADVGALQAAYDRVVTGKREMQILAGPSGIGKSAVVHELRSSLLLHNAVFAAGKYDQLRRHVPFSGLGQALDSVVRRILREPDDVLKAWRERTRNAVGKLGQLMVDVVPSLALLLGQQEPAPQLPPQESENRLFMVLGRFIAALHIDQPVVLFLDDLQWADGGSLKLLRQIAINNQPGAGLLLIGAYRDNEVEPGHALLTSLQEMERTGLRTSVRTLGPLSHYDVVELLADTTHAPRSEVEPLATLVCDKTAGNPFFVHELTRDLWAKGLLRYRDDLKSWHWDLGAVRGAQVSDSVVGLMRVKLAELPAGTQKVLSTAASLGTEFNLQRLRVIYAGEELLSHLDAAVTQGLLIPVDAGHQLIAHGSEDVRYRFAHDRVQQAAYEILSKQEAQVLHHTIGKRLLETERQAGSPVESWVFSVVNHLNLGEGADASDAELQELVQLNLVAGAESRRSAAYETAHSYLEVALNTLKRLGEYKHHGLARTARLAMADCEAVLGRVGEALQRVDEVLAASQTAIEAAEAQVRRVVLLQRLGKGADAIEAGIQGLQRLGFTLRPNETGVRLAQAQIALRLRGRNPEVMADGALSNDPRYRIMSQLLGAISPPMIFVGNGAGYGAAALGTVALAGRHGLNDQALVGFGGAVLDAASRRVDYDSAAKYARLARKMVARFVSAPARAQALMLSYMCHGYLTVSTTQMLAMCDEALQTAMESGDPIATVTFRMVQPALAFQVSLALAQERYQLHMPALNASGDRVRASFAASAAMAAEGLQHGIPVAMTMLDDEIAKAKQFKFTPALAYIRKMMLSYYDRDMAAGLEMARALSKLNFFHSFLDHEILMSSIYVCLLLLENARLRKERPERGADASLWRFASNKVRAAGRASPDVYAGLATLIDAEEATLSDQHERALHLYERAESKLDAAGVLAYRCIALECAGRYMAGQKRRALAFGFLAQARDAYRAWGATTKVVQLEHDFAEIFLSMAAPVQKRSRSGTAGMATIDPTTDSSRSRSRSGSGSYSQTGDTETIDVPALMAAAQALADERDTDLLLPKVLTSIAEIAGATHAVLLMQRGDKFDAIGTDGQVADFPQSIVHYVQRSREPLVLDAADDSDFASDPYVRAQQVKSVLCAPLLYGDQLRGIVYLENRVTTAAFTEERLVSVKVLASQAAVAVENARLYENLEETVAERTAELSAVHAKVVLLERSTTEVQMAGGFAHEMRNALSGPAYALEAAMRDPAKGDLSESMHEVLDSAQSGVVRGLGLIDRILQYAHMERSVGDEESTPLASVVEQAISAVRSRTEGEPIQWDVQGDLPAILALEAGHARTVVEALIANAAEAVTCKSPGSERRISVRCSAVHEGKIDVRVEDTGVGMAQATQARVFEPFFSTKGVGNMGLSLGMTRKIAGLYGGSLEFSTQENRGSEFTLRLPVR